MISAMTHNGVIGNGDDLVVNCKEDMQFFKESTTNNVVIMGGNTYRSIGRALPNRVNIVISRASIDNEAVFEYDDVTKALHKVLTDEELNDKDIYIIGGEQIYSQFIGICHEVYLTIYDNNLYVYSPINDFKYFPVRLLYKLFPHREMIKKVGHYEDNNAGTIWRYFRDEPTKDSD